jgi:lipopolysaccharide export system permease protein
MPLVDRYILKEWCVAFLLTLFLILGVLLLQNMMDDLPDLLAVQASFPQIVHYFLLSLPAYLPLVLPIIFLVSLLFAVGNLHRNNEIIALRAQGLSLFRISPFTLGGGLVNVDRAFLSHCLPGAPDRRAFPCFL